jgi:hypothetical protein
MNQNRDNREKRDQQSSGMLDETAQNQNQNESSTENTSSLNRDDESYM